MHGAKREDKLMPMVVPERLAWASPGTKSGEACKSTWLYRS